MINDDAEYQIALQTVAAQRNRMVAYQGALQAKGLDDDAIKTAIDPIRSFHLQLEEEISHYEAHGPAVTACG
jgi:hypothetical protein